MGDKWVLLTTIETEKNDLSLMDFGRLPELGKLVCLSVQQSEVYQQ